MRRALFFTAFVFCFGTASAHHGWSSFDETKPIYLEGTVKSVKWQNPHAEVMLEVNRAAPPAALARFAIPKQSANVDAVTVIGSAKPPTRKDAVWEGDPARRVFGWQWQGNAVAIFATVVRASVVARTSFAEQRRPSIIHFLD